jgi:hypothetical protein
MDMLSFGKISIFLLIPILFYITEKCLFLLDETNIS